MLVLFHNGLTMVKSQPRFQCAFRVAELLMCDKVIVKYKVIYGIQADCDIKENVSEAYCASDAQ